MSEAALFQPPTFRVATTCCARLPMSSADEKQSDDEGDESDSSPVADGEQKTKKKSSSKHAPRALTQAQWETLRDYFIWKDDKKKPGKAGAVKGSRQRPAELAKRIKEQFGSKSNFDSASTVVQFVYVMTVFIRADNIAWRYSLRRENGNCVLNRKLDKKGWKTKVAMEPNKLLQWIADQHKSGSACKSPLRPRSRPVLRADDLSHQVYRSPQSIPYSPRSTGWPTRRPRSWPRTRR